MFELELSILLLITLLLTSILYKKYLLLKEANIKLLEKINRSTKTLKYLENIHQQEINNYNEYINVTDQRKSIIESYIKDRTYFHLN